MGAHDWGWQLQLFEGSTAKQPQGLEGSNSARRSAILRAERGRLKPTDGAGSPKSCFGALAPASWERFQFLQRRGAGSGREVGRASSPLRAPLPDSRWPCGARLPHAPGAIYPGFLVFPVGDSSSCHSSRCHDISRGQLRQH